MTLEIARLGRISYRDAEAEQRRLSELRLSNDIPDTILLLEHPSIYTAGKQEIDGDFLKDDTWRREQGIDFVTADRGGRLTYHGPGQIVGYLILKLAGRSVPKLVSDIETVIIKTLASFDVVGSRDSEHPGVWIMKHEGPPQKIAAIGLHLSRGVTRHGFSLNVCPNLLHYAGMIPCGIVDRGVTSMKKELGDKTPPVDTVLDRLHLELMAIFQGSNR